MSKLHKLLILKNQMAVAKHEFHLRGSITILDSDKKISNIINNVKTEYIKASSDRLNYLNQNLKNRSVTDVKTDFKNLFVANNKMKTGVNKHFKNECEKKVYFKAWYSGYQNERSQYLAVFQT